MSSPSYIRTGLLFKIAVSLRGLMPGGEEQFNHASGLVIVTQQFDEALLVRRASGSYCGRWSTPGGFRLLFYDSNDGGEQDLESSLNCAVRETMEEIGQIPNGRIRTVPHTFVRTNNRTYDTFVLEVQASERKGFIPSLDYNEVQDAVWHPIDGITKRTDVHPGLQEFFREYRF